MADGSSLILHRNGSCVEQKLIMVQTCFLLQEETGITKVADPLGGSYYVEQLTEDIYQKAKEIIEEVESMGGMSKAVASGLSIVSLVGLLFTF